MLCEGKRVNVSIPSQNFSDLIEVLNIFRFEDRHVALFHSFVSPTSSGSWSPELHLHQSRT